MMSPNPPRLGLAAPLSGAAPAPDIAPTAPAPRWQSQALLAGHSSVEIVHGDQVYRLRLTALGKLILTK